jgi:hypothetical protein
MAVPTDPLRREHERREHEWLLREVEYAARLTDAERSQILDDLWLTVEAIRATKSPEQLLREDEVRRQLDEAGLARYRALAERLA